MNPANRATAQAGREWGIAIFAVAIVGSAFLIFLIQPMVAKRILPWFGGTRSVWMLCLAFYQSALFAGYAYAHALVRFATPGVQAVIHGCVLLLAITALPILPDVSWATAQVEEPTRRIVALLVAEIAVPFVALAATGPLVQAWFARRHPDRSPYPLYALSNIGSMLALFVFPFLVEPRWPLSTAGRGWGLALVGVAAAILACGVMASRSHGQAGRPLDSSPADQGSRAGKERVGLWLLLAATGVVLMMGVSNRLCRDVASVPFLWILPLSVYLLTFIICFSDRAAYRRGVFIGLSLLTIAVSVGTQLTIHAPGYESPPVLESIYFAVILHSALLFSTCMVLHGELYRLKPAPARLTAFYLYVSGGGALGGLFVGLLAPQLFSDYYEVEVGLVLALIGVGGTLWVRKRVSGAGTEQRPSLIWARGVTAFAIILVAGQIGIATYRTEAPIWQERSFFGVLQVIETGEEHVRQRMLRNGSTMHGVQFMPERGRRLPTTYYGRATPLGAWMRMRRPEKAIRVGVVGLGVGTVAAYGRPGDLVRFYEIDPAVAQVAGPDGYFHFLEDSAATIEVELGDARLVLEEERASGRQQDFDILILDAFSSDSIPVHLMTKEAFEGYRAALSDQGVIAAHVTNRHLELMPVVSRLGHSIGFQSIQLTTMGVPGYQSQAARWVFLSASPERLAALTKTLRRLHMRMRLGDNSLRVNEPSPADIEAAPLWTDEYTDLFGVLKPL